MAARYRAEYTITPSDSGHGYDVGHTAYTHLIDRAGRLRHVFSHLDSPETVAAGLRAVLRSAP